MSEQNVSKRPDEFYVLDCSLHDEESGLYCFCPIQFESDGSVRSIVIGMNYLSTEPPDGTYFVGVVHENGQDACDAWCAEHDEFLHDLFERRGKRPEFA